jgi:hypothetical protein
MGIFEFYCSVKKCDFRMCVVILWVDKITVYDIGLYNVIYCFCHCEDFSHYKNKRFVRGGFTKSVYLFNTYSFEFFLYKITLIKIVSVHMILYSKLHAICPTEFQHCNLYLVFVAVTCLMMKTWFSSGSVIQLNNSEPWTLFMLFDFVKWCHLFCLCCNGKTYIINVYIIYFTFLGALFKLQELCQMYYFSCSFQLFWNKVLYYKGWTSFMGV